MPEIHRGVAVAYCDAPGPLEQSAVPTFVAVAPTPSDWDEGQSASFYREYNGVQLHDLSVHEAMPGHVLQLAHAQGLVSPTRVRRFGRSGVFIEGWAVYAEELMVARGYRPDADPRSGPALRLQQLKMQARMTINAILDIGVHAHGLPEAEGRWLMRDLGFQEEGEIAGQVASGAADVGAAADLLRGVPRGVGHRRRPPGHALGVERTAGARPRAVARIPCATAPAQPPRDLGSRDVDADRPRRRVTCLPRSPPSTCRPSTPTPTTSCAVRAASPSASPPSRCDAATCCDRTLARPGFAGLMAYSLAEAVWLVGAGRHRRARGLPERRPGVVPPHRRGRDARARDHRHGRRSRAPRAHRRGGRSGRPPRARVPGRRCLPARRAACTWASAGRPCTPSSRRSALRAASCASLPCGWSASCSTTPSWRGCPTARRRCAR